VVIIVEIIALAPILARVRDWAMSSFLLRLRARRRTIADLFGGESGGGGRV
jgi:hypothetical protein